MPAGFHRLCHRVECAPLLLGIAKSFLRLYFIYFTE